ncbi:rhodanese-like domain-containing protein [Kitasatospora sp. NPDC049285]|uniref:rhodanese-like domain-containing protein n=1 Tax=Kitasatospora sp. NPDC049285 TaxID=3157096 RepID=UPI0034271929
MAWSHQPSAPAQLDPAEAHRLAATGAAVLLDVREPEEYAEVHAPGAVPVALDTLTDGGVPAVIGSRVVLAVCRSGNRSQAATDLLVSLGVPAVNVAGGMRAWVRAGLPVHQGECCCGSAI